MGKQLKNICILIPAYNPDNRLIQLVEEIKHNVPETPVVIINDGSNSDIIFNNLLKMCPSPERILSHSKNLGKGEALKNGFNYILENYPEYKGIVTADCDLQHSVEDIVKVCMALNNSPENLYLGSREFKGGNVPLRSIIGNISVSFFMNLVHNISLKDTQTGLRGIPAKFAGNLLDINLSDFSFETEMLIKAKKYNIKIIEIPIKTIYIDKNKSSHFKPLKHTIEISKTILKGAK